MGKSEDQIKKRVIKEAPKVPISMIWIGMWLHVISRLLCSFIMQWL